MGNALKHKFVSTKSQSPDSTLVSKNEWNDEHLFNPPATGALLYGRTTESDKAAWLAPAAAAGRVLRSIDEGGGVIVPAWSGALEDSQLLFGDFIQDANLDWDNTAKVLKLFGGGLGTNGQKVLTLGLTTSPPTTSPADSVQAYVADLAAGQAGLHLRDEGGRVQIFGYGAHYFPETTDPATAPATTIALYAKDTGGTPRLYTKDDAGVTRQLRHDGDLLPTGEVRNLAIKHTAAAEAESVTITADAIDIEGARATAVSVVVSLAVSGEGGLDTGTESADTHYFLWLIRKSSDGTVSGIWSTSSTAPTMPSGYDQKRLISHRRNDGSSNLIRAVQCDEFVLCHATVLASTVTADTDLDLSDFVPAVIADFVYLAIHDTGTIEWQFDDKDDPTLSYGLIIRGGTIAEPRAWVRKNAANLVSVNEVSGTATITAIYLVGWKVKGL